MKRLILCLYLAALGAGMARAAAPAEKKFKQDMAYYEKTAKSKKMNANDRIYILERLRGKYREADFDLSPLYAEIDRWYGERLKDKTTQKAADAPASPAGGRLTQVLVTEGKDGSRLVLDAPGNEDFKDEIKRDEKGANPPVILIYLYGTREALDSASKNFSVKTGAIRQFMAEAIPGTPPTVKVQLALREERPYKVERDGSRIILTLEAAAPAPELSENPPPAPVAESTETISISLIGAVKTQGRLDVKPGTKLLEAVYLAGGFTDDAAPDRLRVVRKDQGEKVTMQANAAQAKDLILKSGDLVIVPEISSLKQKIFNGKIVPWATFFISMGLVLALLI